MKKLIPILCILYICTTGIAASPLLKKIPIEAFETKPASVILTVTEKTVNVKNATIGSDVEIYNILGIRVAVYKIDSSDKTITLNLPKGWYTLKVDNFIRKMAIK